MTPKLFATAGATDVIRGPAVYITKERKDEVIVSAVRARMLGKESAIWLYDKGCIWRGEARHDDRAALDPDRYRRTYSMVNNTGRAIRIEFWSYPGEVNNDEVGEVTFHAVHPSMAVDAGSTLMVSVRNDDSDHKSHMTDAMNMTLQRLKAEMEIEQMKLKMEGNKSLWEVFRRGSKT